MYRIANQIREFINRDDDILKLPMLPIIEYHKELELIGYTNDGKWDIEPLYGNFHIKYDDCNLHILELSGSLYYGEYKLKKL